MSLSISTCAATSGVAVASIDYNRMGEGAGERGVGSSGSALLLISLEHAAATGTQGAKDRDGGWRVVGEALTNLPAPVLRITPAGPQGAFVQLQGEGGTLWATVTEGALNVRPATWDGGRLPLSCAVAR
jgi:hypothetical protein